MYWAPSFFSYLSIGSYSSYQCQWLHGLSISEIKHDWPTVVSMLDHRYRYVNTPSGNIGVYDPAEIHNRQLLKGFMKEAMVKLGHQLVFFFIFLYRSVGTIRNETCNYNNIFHSSLIIALLSGPWVANSESSPAKVFFFLLIFSPFFHFLQLNIFFFLRDAVHHCASRRFVLKNYLNKLCIHHTVVSFMNGNCCTSTVGST